MPSPTLIIRRLVVEGELSCDLKFHRGLNVIAAVLSNGDPRSTNKCGKTAAVELIQYGLGRRHESKAKFYFAPILDKLRILWLEIEANGQVMTISRSLQQITGRIRIYEGPYVAGMEGTPAEMANVEDLSSILLNILGIPQVSVKTAEGVMNPLTFPLLARAFILHQEDSFGAILDKVQPDQRRADVIGFLTRITPYERFPLEEEMGAVQREAQDLENQVRSISAFLEARGVPSLLEASLRVRSAEGSLGEARENRRNLQREMLQAVNGQKGQRQGYVERLRREHMEIDRSIAQLEQQLFGLRNEAERLEEVISTLSFDKQKSHRLQASTAILSSVEFGICPRCLLDITPEMKQREQYSRCSLCSRPIRSTSDSLPRLMPRTPDLDLQIEEAEAVLTDTRREFQEAEKQITELRTQREAVSISLEEESRVYVSPLIDQLVELTHDVSLKEGDLARSNELLRLAEGLAFMQAQLDELRNRQAQLSERLDETRRASRTRLEGLRQEYSNVLKDIDFPNYRECKIDSRTLMPWINGSLYIHVGTALKGLATVAYHLSLLKLARGQDTFFPRMLVIDSPAVGDLNEINHVRLLRYIANFASEEALNNETCQEWPDWQIILTTRKVIPEIEEHIVERLSSPGRMLLR